MRGLVVYEERFSGKLHNIYVRNKPTYRRSKVFLSNQGPIIALRDWKVQKYVVLQWPLLYHMRECSE